MKLSLRARITVMFVATVLIVGLSLIGLVYAYLRLTPVPFEAHIGEGDLRIDAAVPVADDILRVVLGASLSVLAVLTALAGAIGWFVAGWVIRPLQDIAATAREVAGGELDTRVAYAGPRDEVADVAGALNTMLDSLAASLAAHKRFAANASHELKTPVATIQTMADVALGAPEPDAAELREAVTRIREVNAKQSGTIEALLQLADVQSGRSLNREPVAPSELCREVAAHRGLEAQVAEGVAVFGDEALIRQAVDNLARNAVEHGVAGTGTLALRADGTVTVANAVTPDQNASEVAARLAHGEPFAGPRVRGRSGHGLGVALVQAIAEAHGGRLELGVGDDGRVVAAVAFNAWLK